jgi:hypothetical protein
MVNVGDCAFLYDTYMAYGLPESVVEENIS